MKRITWRSGSRKKVEKIRRKYGSIPSVDKELDQKILTYWEEYGENLPVDEIVDEITWNDLEMDRIFHRMNTTDSFAGEQMLYYKLHQTPRSKELLHQFEHTIHAFEGNVALREEMEMKLMRLGKERSSYAIPSFIKTLQLQQVRFVPFFRFLQLTLVGSFLLTVLTGANWAFIVFLVIVMTNLIVYMREKGRYDTYLDTLGGIIRIVRFCKQIDKEDNPLVGSELIQAYLEPLRKLSFMVAALQYKKRATLTGDAMSILQDYLFGLTLWDFIQYDKVLRILRSHEYEFMKLYELVGNVDAAIAIASFRASLPAFCIPDFMEAEVSEKRTKKICAEGLFHPLLNQAVGNKINFANNCLITGSNASGKSTFIKAVAVNMILAQSIHTCTADVFSLPDARVMTSMAVRDDMLHGESYFTREVKYLKRIVTASEEDRFLLCVVDEILRGTNTQERIVASYAVLSYLAEKNCLAIVASHDVELASLLKDRYKMYYFCEEMAEEGIKFDYKIKEGVNDSHNAIRLLEYTGFPASIVQTAYREIG